MAKKRSRRRLQSLLILLLVGASLVVVSVAFYVSTHSSTTRTRASEGGLQTYSGVIRETHIDHFKKGVKDEPIYYFIDQDQNMSAVEFIGEFPDQLIGQPLSFKATKDGSTLHINTDDINALRTNEYSSYPTTDFPYKLVQGTKKIAIIMVSFDYLPAYDNSGPTPDPSHLPYTTDEVRSVFFTGANSVNNYFKKNSFGKVSFAGYKNLNGDIYGWYYAHPYAAEYAIDCSPTGVVKMIEEARHVARYAQDSDYLQNENKYSYNFFILQNSRCNASGAAYVTDGPAYVMLGKKTDTDLLYVATHELGHVLGLNHANEITCTQEGLNPLKGFGHCLNDEYGDSFDVMGGYPITDGRGNSFLYHLNAAHMDALDFLDYPASANQSSTTSHPVNVRVIERPGTYTYTLYPIDAAARTRLQVLKIYRPKSTDYRYMYLELRSLPSFIDNTPSFKGVYVHILDDTPTIKQMNFSYLIDASANTSRFTDYALRPNEPLVDPLNTITIRVTYNHLSSSNPTATVRVVVGQ